MKARKAWLVLCGCLLGLSGIGQDVVRYQCGSDPFFPVHPSAFYPPTTEVHVVKVYVHDFVGYDRDTLFTRLQAAASFFLPHKICFMLSGHQVYNPVPQYMGTMNVKDAAAVNALGDLEIAGHINLFLHGKLRQGMQDFNTWYEPDGYTYAIPGISLSIGALRATTLAHQLGHCLGLYDTAESAFGSENVGTAGGCSNCTTAGDLLCATPADRVFPDSVINNSCFVFPSPYRDVCNNLITGIPKNLMSLSKESCKDNLVAAQGDRARSFLLSASALAPTVANNSLTVTVNATYTSGVRAFATRNFITLQAAAYSSSASARTDFSSREITVKPGASFNPSGTGYTQLLVNRVDCN